MVSGQDQDILERLSQALQFGGIKSWPTGNLGFTSAYVRRTWLFQASIVFLVSELDAEQVDPNEVDRIIQRARQWCGQTLGLPAVLRLLSKTSLNLVLLHKGQVPLAYIQGKLDKSGLHLALLQSITSINIDRNTVEQEKSLVVLGAARTALSKLLMI